MSAWTATTAVRVTAKTSARFRETLARASGGVRSDEDDAVEPPLRLSLPKRVDRPKNYDLTRVTMIRRHYRAGIADVSKWVSLHSFEVGLVPDAMTRRADGALGRRSRATASRRLNAGRDRHV